MQDGEAGRLQRALSSERAGVAARLHDSALQLLLATSQDLAAAADGDAEALVHARSSLAAGIAELRHLLTDTQGLGATVESPGRMQQALLLFITDAARRGGFLTEIEIGASAELRHPVLMNQLIREFVGNIAKHARASHVSITLRTDDREARLRVWDDGVGIPSPRANAFRGHLGLTLSLERITAVGGTLEIAAGPDAIGTTMLVTIPQGLCRASLREDRHTGATALTATG